jgi:hypothetical protein
VSCQINQERTRKDINKEHYATIWAWLAGIGEAVTVDFFYKRWLYLHCTRKCLECKTGITERILQCA